MEYLFNSRSAAAAVFSSSSSILKSVLPKTDPARSITAGAIVYLSWKHVLYPSLVWAYQLLRSKIREKNHAKFRAQQKKDVVYLYMYPKKPNEIPKLAKKSSTSAAEKKKKGAATMKSKKSEDEQEQQQSKPTESTTESSITPPEEEESVPADENQRVDDFSVSLQSSSSPLTKTNDKKDDPTVINKLRKMFSMSCPCVSVELFLRINKIPFEEIIVMDADDVSPTGRLPVIEFNGETFTDSFYILDFLEKRFNTTEQQQQHVVVKNVVQKKDTDEEKDIGENNDDGDDDAPSKSAVTTTLTPEDAEAAVAFKKRRKANFAVLEESKAQVSVQRLIESLRLCYGRAILVDHVDAMIRLVSAEFNYPKPIVSWIFKSHRKETISMLNQQGLGDLTDEQFQKTFLDDVKTLTAFITANPTKAQEHPNDVVKSRFVLGGKSPTKIDFLVVPWLNILRFYESEKKISANCPAIAFAIECPVITDYLKKFDKLLCNAL